MKQKYVKQMKKSGVYLILILLSGFLTCKNEKALVDAASINEIVLVETVYADISEQIEVNIYNAEDILFNGHKTGQNNLKETCANLSIAPFDTITWPKTITVDFGNSNCLGDDGRSRRGKVLISTTGRYHDSTTVLTVTFDNYYLNNNKVSGTATITNQGVNKASYPQYSVSIQNGIIETTNGTITWQSDGTKQWVNGIATPWPANNDDVFIFTGSSYGAFTNGVPFKADIIQPLVTNTACPWISGGTVEISKQQKIIGTLDFGGNTCDSSATVIFNGDSYGVGLK